MDVFKPMQREFEYVCTTSTIKFQERVKQMQMHCNAFKSFNEKARTREQCSARVHAHGPR